MNNATPKVDLWALRQVEDDIQVVDSEGNVQMDGMHPDDATALIKWHNEAVLAKAREQDLVFSLADTEQLLMGTEERLGSAMERIKELEEENARLTTLRPMSEAPRDGTEIVAQFSPNAGFVVVCSESGDLWSEADGYMHYDSDFTGWLPLPTPAPEAMPND